MKYVLVSGGVISGVGKGIIASSSGLLLKTLGFRVTAIKIDPYLNVDAGTLGPTEHGECFVLRDGGESDLDLGSYERYLGVNLSSKHNITTGKIFQQVIDAERRGEYLGRTVQVVPHITDAIQEWVREISRMPIDDSGEEPEVCIVELGGTVGDIESMAFVEALTAFRHAVGKNNFVNIHVSYVPTIHGELKTKPTQHAIRTMRSAGLIPDLIACRSQGRLDDATVKKIAKSCQVEYDQVLNVRDISSLYQVPQLLMDQGLLKVLSARLELPSVQISAAAKRAGQEFWSRWQKTVATSPHLEIVSIALVGKYTESPDSYLSVIKALEHAAMTCNRQLNLVWINSEHLEDSTLRTDPSIYHNAWSKLTSVSGCIVPGGFGNRGIKGMIKAANWSRERKVPFLGVCLGMQIAVIEVAQSLCDLPDATSEEYDPKAEHQVVCILPESKGYYGGTMRLGEKTTVFVPGSEWSKLRALYGNQDLMLERHRHRYEINPKYVEKIEKAGLIFIGKDEEGRRMEVAEIRDHPFFVGVQAHPEFTSRVLAPSPTYLGFVAASSGCLEEITSNVCLATKATNGVKKVETP